MSHQTHNDDRDYPVIDRVHDESDEPTVVDRDPDGTEADADVEAEYQAARPDDGTTILPVDASYDGTDTDRDRDERAGRRGRGRGRRHRREHRRRDRRRVRRGRLRRGAGAPRGHPRRRRPRRGGPGRPGDPLPGDALADGRDETPATGDATVIAVDDVAAQDPGVVVVPPVTDDAGSVQATDPDATAGPAAEVVPVPVPVETGSSVAGGTTAPGAGSDERWRELQLTFVDDPAAAVREAADLLEQAIADLRQQYEGSDSTEDLRTAFRRYRDVYRSLSG